MLQNTPHRNSVEVVISEEHVFQHPMPAFDAEMLTAPFDKGVRGIDSLILPAFLARGP